MISKEDLMKYMCPADESDDGDLDIDSAVFHMNAVVDTVLFVVAEADKTSMQRFFGALCKAFTTMQYIAFERKESTDGVVADNSSRALVQSLLTVLEENTPFTDPVLLAEKVSSFAESRRVGTLN